MIRTELYTHEILPLFARFRDELDEKHWKKRCLGIKKEIRGNNYLRDYLKRENDIVFTLERCSNEYHKYEVNPTALTKDRSIYPAMRFVAQSLSMIDALEEKQAKVLIRRIQGAIRNSPCDLRAIQLEMAVATHCVRRGYDVIWPESSNNEDTFDLLVSDIGPNGLEIECKLISEDTGIKIKSREALRFYHLLESSKVIRSILNKLTYGVLVVLTLPDKLPTKHQELKELSSRVIEQIEKISDNTFDDGVRISIDDFNVGELDGLIDLVSSTCSEKAFVRENNSRSGALMFIVKSGKDDNKLDAIFKTLGNSARKQFSGLRPALFMVGLSGISCSDLADIAKRDADSSNAPTALRVSVSKFLDSLHRDHLVGVGFMNEINGFGGGISGAPEGGGKVYMFTRNESALWDESVADLFRQSDGVN